MTITTEQAISNLTHFYQARFSSDSSKHTLQAGINVLKSAATLPERAIAIETENAYLQSIDNIFYIGKVDLGAFPSSPRTADMAKFKETIQPTELVDFVYPDASSSDKAALIEALENGSISSVDLMYGWLDEAPKNPSPSAQDLFEAIHEAGRGNLDIGAPSDLPDSTLHFEGISDAQLEFLVAVYVGAFGRAPEFEGLKYWAGYFAQEVQKGTPENDVFRLVSNSMYEAGRANGESGTGLDNSAYITHLYENVLGRAQDSGGHAYWLDELNKMEGQGMQYARGEMLVPFLRAALNAERDGDYLDARVTVAEYAAQEHVSGASAPGIDLKAVLEGITNDAEARAAVQSIVDTYGTGAGPQVAPLAQADAFDLVLHMLVLQDDQAGADSGPEVIEHGGIELVGTTMSADELTNDFVRLSDLG